MRILIVTDAWAPQVNGVVRTLTTLTSRLESFGQQVTLIAPHQFSSVPCPTYPDIRLALTTRRAVGARIELADPDAVHIATEGPLGLAARRWCLDHGVAFTTAYHTKFPEYVSLRTGLPAGLFWRYIRWFHAPSHGVLASTASVARELNQQGLGQTKHWGRGVDLARFHPGVPPHAGLRGLPRPILLYVGRVAVEKNVETFLRSRHPGSKVVVGNGPALPDMQRRYGDASFMGVLHGEELASAYAAADVLVFPSRTDTFGLVMIEALASGTPVAAYPVPGPVDVLRDDVGAMDADLDVAIAQALRLRGSACVRYAQGFSWEESARQFLSALRPLGLGQLRNLRPSPA